MTPLAGMRLLTLAINLPGPVAVAQLRRLIEEAGREPIERDTLYREVVRDSQRWHVGRALAGV